MNKAFAPQAGPLLVLPSPSRGGGGGVLGGFVDALKNITKLNRTNDFVGWVRIPTTLSFVVYVMYITYNPP